MVSSLLLEIGQRSLDRLAGSSARQAKAKRHPLAAYPRLQSLLGEAERNGMLAAERRKLVARRLSL